MALLTELNQAGQTIVMVTHDARVASRAHRTVHLTNGVVREPERQGRQKTSGPLASKEVAP
jgi:putative ABC transport system ATP-binding protein